MINTDEDVSAEELAEQFDIFKSIITEELAEFEHFTAFYEDLVENLREENADPEDDALFIREDAISGGLEVFVAFNFSSTETTDSVYRLLEEYEKEREDSLDLVVQDLTGRDKTVEVSILNQDVPDLSDSFGGYFRSY